MARKAWKAWREVGERVGSRRRALEDTDKGEGELGLKRRRGNRGREAERTDPI